MSILISIILTENKDGNSCESCSFLLITQVITYAFLSASEYIILEKRVHHFQTQDDSSHFL